MTRKTKEFNKLLLQYKATPIVSRSKIFWEMMRKAKSFSDWTAIYQYGDDSIRKDAQREMEKLVLKGRKKTDVQLNILELFMVIDESDKDEILRKYLEKHHQKDDILFVLSCAGDSDLWSELFAEVQDYYDDYDELERELSTYRESLLQESTFNPWRENFRGGREGKPFRPF